jgi:hypothetical protein
MSAGRAILAYDSDPKLREVIDATAGAFAENMEIAYGADAMTAQPEIPATLREITKFFLKHGIIIVVKHTQAEPTDPLAFSLLHPDYDDVKVNMEPSPRLTITRYIPALKKTESTVLGEAAFRVYRGGLTDIDMEDLMTFLGYTFAE